jgi:hypothetical protein
MYFDKTLCFCKAHHMTFLVTLSDLFQVNKNNIQIFFLLYTFLYNLYYQENLSAINPN